uniref:Uncharacterized protein n=1 Tax=Rhizophora mucronata TaxID=61149 RepID=A0A2P2NAF7_RHIMU
MPKNNSTS